MDGFMFVVDRIGRELAMAEAQIAELKQENQSLRAALADRDSTAQSSGGNS